MPLRLITPKITGLPPVTLILISAWSATPRAFFCYRAFAMHPRQRLQRIIDECSQIVTDAQSWNDNRPDDQPIDVEDSRVMLSMARDAAHYWDAGFIDEAKARMSRLSEYADILAR